MIDLNELQILSQLMDNVDISVSNMGKAFNEKDSESFEKSKKEILNTQIRIDKIIK